MNGFYSLMCSVFWETFTDRFLVSIHAGNESPLHQLQFRNGARNAIKSYTSEAWTTPKFHIFGCEQTRNHALNAYFQHAGLSPFQGLVPDIPYFWGGIPSSWWSLDKSFSSEATTISSSFPHYSTMKRYIFCTGLPILKEGSSLFVFTFDSDHIRSRIVDLIHKKGGTTTL